MNREEPSSRNAWRRVNVEDVCTAVSVGIVVQPTQYYVAAEDGVRAFRSANVGENTIIDRDWVYLSLDGHQANSKSALQTGDVLVVRSGAPGTACVVTDQYAGSNCIDIVFARPRPTEVISEYLAEFTNSPVGKRHVLGMQGGLALQHFNVGAYKKLELLLPSLSEQQEIVDLLAAWDAAIETTQRLIAAKNQLLSHLREHHLTKPQQSKRIKLKAATHESTARNGKRLGREAIMAVTKQVGMRPMREETIAAAIDRYKVVRPQAFAYNPMRLNIGSIAMSSFDDDVLVSPDYVVFECNEEKLLPGYLNHLRRTRLWASHFEAAGSGGVRIRIYYDDLGAFTFPLPPLAEQTRVLAVLDAGVAEIETLERYLAALKTQKRGLMQKLLTGQWRVNLDRPEAR